MNDEARPYPLITDAIDSGDWHRVSVLLERFPEMRDFRVPAFGSWLHYAAAHGTLEIVQHLVALGFDVNARDDSDGQTPLDNACLKAKGDIVRYLLHHGAELDTTTAVRNPLFGAIIGRSSEIAVMLLAAGADTRPCYKLGSVDEGVDAVAFAMLHGTRDIARLIALHNHDGDAVVAEAAMAEGLRVAEAITKKPRGR